MAGSTIEVPKGECRLDNEIGEVIAEMQGITLGSSTYAGACRLSISTTDSSSGISTFYSGYSIGMFCSKHSNETLDGVFIGSPQQFRLATKIGLFTRKRNMLLVSPGDVSQSQVEGGLDELREMGVPVYDVRDDSVPISSRTCGNHLRYTYEIPTFSGELDAKFALTYAKSGFIAELSDCWQSSFLIDESGPHTGLTAMKRAKSLARALTLDRYELYVPEGRGTGKSLSKTDIHFLSRCDIKQVRGVDERVDRSLDTLRRVRDCAALWKKQADDMHLSIRISEGMLNDVEGTLAIFRGFYELLNMECLLDAYDKGVPVEDLVA